MKNPLVHWFGAYLVVVLILIALMVRRQTIASRYTKRTGKRVSNLPFGRNVPDEVRRADRLVNRIAGIALFCAMAYSGAVYLVWKLSK